MKSRTLDILGTKYELLLKDEADDPAFKQCGGYRDAFAKQIVINDFKPDETNPMETKSLQAAVKQNIRHEIVHAFIYESGLHKNTLDFDNGWADNEEMVDWFAIQGPKIYAAWKEAGAI